MRVWDVVKPLILVYFMLFPVLSLGTTYRVDMLNFAFDAESLTVNQGDTVLWVDIEGFHTTTSGVNGVHNGLWDSGSMSPGDSFAFVFDTLGIFPYYCTFHWETGMTGVIVVNPTGAEEIKSKIPVNFNIRQNHPNPFNVYTVIEYELNIGAMTELVIYNASGQSVMTLVKQHREPGKYSVRWDGLNNKGQRVSNGVYFYEFKVGDGVMYKKMMIMR